MSNGAVLVALVLTQGYVRTVRSVTAESIAVSHVTRRLLGVALGGCGLFLAGAGPASAKLTVLGTYDRPGTVAAGHGWVVTTRAESGSTTLFVGRLGETPTLVTAAKSLPSFAQPHVGTDARGRAVIVYPSCGGKDCNLNLLDPDRGTVRSAPGASQRGVEEVEGDMDRGALAYAISSVDRPSIESTFKPTTGLAYRPHGGTSRMLTPLGGTQLDLDRGRVLSVRSIYDEDEGGNCGMSLLELTTVSGRRSLVARQSCGEDFQRITGAAFLGKRRVVWGVTAFSGSTYLRRDLVAGARTQQVRAAGGFISYAPLDSRSAVVRQGNPSFSLDDPVVDDGESPPAFPLVEVNGIVHGAGSARDQRR